MTLQRAIPDMRHACRSLIAVLASLALAACAAEGPTLPPVSAVPPRPATPAPLQPQLPERVAEIARGTGVMVKKAPTRRAETTATANPLPVTCQVNSAAASVSENRIALPSAPTAHNRRKSGERSNSRSEF